MVFYPDGASHSLVRISRHQISYVSPLDRWLTYTVQSFDRVVVRTVFIAASSSLCDGKSFLVSMLNMLMGISQFEWNHDIPDGQQRWAALRDGPRKFDSDRHLQVYFSHRERSIQLPQVAQTVVTFEPDEQALDGPDGAPVVQ
jgi:hypothetical protein